MKTAGRKSGRTVTLCGGSNQETTEAKCLGRVVCGDLEPGPAPPQMRAVRNSKGQHGVGRGWRNEKRCVRRYFVAVGAFHHAQIHFRDRGFAAMVLVRGQCGCRGHACVHARARRKSGLREKQHADQHLAYRCCQFAVSSHGRGKLAGGTECVKHSLEEIPLRRQYSLFATPICKARISARRNLHAGATADIS